MPQEQMNLGVEKYLKDFTYEMADGTWAHFEFKKDPITENDLRMLRAYEAAVGYKYGVEVVTYVICTFSETPRDVLEQGINTYRVRTICLSDRNADETVGRLEQRQAEAGLSHQELLEALLIPLLPGKLSQKERIERSLRLVQEESGRLSEEEATQMESVLYAFANKFLTGAEMEGLREMFRMTALG